VTAAGNAIVAERMHGLLDQTVFQGNATGRVSAAAFQNQTRAHRPAGSRGVPRGQVNRSPLLEGHKRQLDNYLASPAGAELAERLWEPR